MVSSSRKSLMSSSNGKPIGTWKFNPGKCQVLQITRSRSPVQTSYTMHGQTLEVVSCAKYLGVDISNDLSWKAHISRITGNANQSLGFLRRNLKATNPALREKAYKAIVRPQLEYAAPVWDPHIQDDISKIEMDHSRAARWVLEDYSPCSSVSDMLEKLGWRTLERRRTDYIWTCRCPSPWLCHPPYTYLKNFRSIGL